MGSPAIFSGSRTKLLTSEGLLLGSKAVIDNDGVRNYIANGHAEINTNGWATYADAAGTTPVDGTGGSPASTFTRSTAVPIRGAASFRWTKSAANRQGEGFSYDFTLDFADLGNQVSITYDYHIVSGTYVTGDMTAWIYDVGNSALIPLTAYQVVSVGVGLPTRSQTMTFQAPINSTNMRLIFHTATTSASAYTIDFDDFKVGPQFVPAGFAGSDAISFTPTGSATTNSTYTGKWSRVGEDMICTINIAYSGAPNAFGNLQVNLPSGYTIDTSKLPGTVTSQVTPLDGSGVHADTGTILHPIKPYYNSTTSVILYSATLASTPNATYNSIITPTVPFSIGNTDQTQISFRVPIVGWSSNVICSDSAATRVVAASAYLSASQTGVNPNGSFVKVAFNAMDFDTHGAFDTTNNRYVIKVPGKYRVSSLVIVNGTNVLASAYGIYAFKNGSAIKTLDVKTPSVSTPFTMTGTTTLDLVGGDYVEIHFFGAGNNSASTLSLTHLSINTSFAVEMLQGPAQIQAATTIALKVGKTSGSHTSTGNLQDITSWDTPAKDSVGAFNSTTGEYTIQAPGDYWATLKVVFASNATGARQCQILRNGSIAAISPDMTGAVSTGTQVTVLLENCVVGEVIKTQAFQSSGGNLAYTTLAGFMNFQLSRTNGVN